jgi:hypothetical protein
MLMSLKCVRFGKENPGCSNDAIILDPEILKKGDKITLWKELKKAGIGKEDTIMLCPGCNLPKYELPSYSAMCNCMKFATNKICQCPKYFEAKLCDKQ